MKNKQPVPKPTGFDIIFTLKNLGFTVVHDEGTQVTLSDRQITVTIPRGAIPDSMSNQLRNQIRTVLARYGGAGKSSETYNMVKRWSK